MHTKTYTFQYFYQAHLDLITMVSRVSHNSDPGSHRTSLSSPRPHCGSCRQ